MMNWQAEWIKPQRDMGNIASEFRKRFVAMGQIESATLTVTALGVYEAVLNEKRVGDFVLAPGWTAYKTRLQYQTYDVTALLQEHNELKITVAKGWYRSRLSATTFEKLKARPAGLFAQLEIRFRDGSTQTVATEDSWEVAESEIRFSEIYDGETCDGGFCADTAEKTEVFDGPSDTLIPQEGEKIVEHEIISAARILTTPKGEKVIDFGQEVTGYIELTVDAKAGQRVRLSHGEMLDRDGNFYNANYRSAKAELTYICRDGVQTYHPRFTFFGFRYARIEEFPGGADKATADAFRAIAVYSDLKRTGWVSCSSPLLNKLFDNIFWGQKDNYLDLPTDCPQRDERLGYTGDTQVFARAATYNFDVEKFLSKWLNCLRAEQTSDGYVGDTVPDAVHEEGTRYADDDPAYIYNNAHAGWGDAAIICPWTVYQAYGNEEILRRQYDSMRKWLDYIANQTEEPDLWIGGYQYGDWLGLDGGEDSYKGGSRDGFVASAFYAYSTGLFVKIGKLLGEDVSAYEASYERIVKKLRTTFGEYTTQTECALAVVFRIAEDCQKASDQLADMVRKAGHLTTGFLGTPCLLHALSDFGHADVAYDLLLREEYPSWLYSVKKGATTIWEHWDGMKEDGTFWDTNMNSFNHYAYGAVIDWVYGVAAGIKPLTPGYATVRIAPVPDARLDWLKVDFDSRYGRIHSEWKKQDGGFRYEITTPVEAEIAIGDREYRVPAGNYCWFYEK